ncbi:tRNA 2'-phosphotransferase 1 isoform X3 [Sminthopsis crassicaudata]
MNPPGGRRTRRPREQDPDVRLSKALSYALRHGAVKMGLPMGSDGFVPLDALLRLAQFRDFSEEDVRRVVRTNAKQRFALRPGPPGGCASIRANQGHSLQVADLELTPLRAPQDLPPVLVHGTYRRHWRSIRREGLSRRGRTHIHLCPGLPGETHALSGMRADCEVAVLIDGPSALADGIPFFCSANGVILTPGDARGFLPPKYFKEALQLGSQVSTPTPEPRLGARPLPLALRPLPPCSHPVVAPSPPYPFLCLREAAPSGWRGDRGSEQSPGRLSQRLRRQHGECATMKCLFVRRQIKTQKTSCPGISTALLGGLA